MRATACFVVEAIGAGLALHRETLPESKGILVGRNHLEKVMNVRWMFSSIAMAPAGIILFDLHTVVTRYEILEGESWKLGGSYHYSDIHGGLPPINSCLEQR